MPESPTKATSSEAANSHSTAQDHSRIKKKPRVEKIRPNDIICSRSSFAFNNKGNKRFRRAISKHVKRYNSVTSRKDRSAVIMSVLCELLDKNGARFLKQVDENIYEVLRETSSREKVGHAVSAT
jgi:hypothetical protein